MQTADLEALVAHLWRLLFLSGPQLNMGMDSQCFISLEEAFRDSMASRPS
jgi:hypothetical protein